ncbi:longitudinals lacking protein, isoforms H/M/V [Lingula anatina]|uniref:Longitudinals lacking protein, isoforms H/M/V n=1 Tax=Lingula anatina TaxID=7574 RepID=A0A1S3JLI4_LINAN|nr:longitudinals lacking protein, isoforms H/M/V [Lingula anatina]|eukprot:XP_013411232.1 longitudinals lacking protein, isoforms H/M/V [Lingula anatina]
MAEEAVTEFAEMAVEMQPVGIISATSASVTVPAHFVDQVSTLDVNQLAAQELAQLASTPIGNNVNQVASQVQVASEVTSEQPPPQPSQSGGYPIYLYRLSEHAATLLKSLDNMRNDPDSCDAKITCRDGPPMFSHQYLLIACSPYFKRRFRSGGEINIDLPSQPVKRILDFIYTGEISIKSEDVFPLLKAAETLMIQSLMDICVDYMKTHNIGLKPSADGVTPNLEEGWNLDLCKDEGSSDKPLTLRQQESAEAEEYSDEEYEYDAVSGKRKRRRSSNPYPWACPHCKFRTLSKKRLEEHVANHSADFAYKCALCTFTAKSNQSLVKHISSGHTTEELKNLPQNADYSWMYPPEQLDTSKKASIKAKSTKALLAMNSGVEEEEQFVIRIEAAPPAPVESLDHPQQQQQEGEGENQDQETLKQAHMLMSAGQGEGDNGHVLLATENCDSGANGNTSLEAVSEG